MNYEQGDLDDFIVKLGSHPRNWLKRLPPDRRAIAKQFESMNTGLQNRFESFIEDKIWNREDFVEALENYGVTDTAEFVDAFWDPEMGKKLLTIAVANVGIKDAEKVIEEVMPPLLRYHAFWMCFKSLSRDLPDSIYSLEECRKQWERGDKKEREASFKLQQEKLEEAKELHALILKLIGVENKETRIADVGVAEGESDDAPPKSNRIKASKSKPWQI